jgi:hypothetical protein
MGCFGYGPIFKALQLGSYKIIKLYLQDSLIVAYKYLSYFPIKTEQYDRELREIWPYSMGRSPTTTAGLDFCCIMNPEQPSHVLLFYIA